MFNVSNSCCKIQQQRFVFHGRLVMKKMVRQYSNAISNCYRDISMEQHWCVNSVQGTTHQASSRYSHLSRGKQCTAISFFALLYSSVVSLTQWTFRSAFGVDVIAVCPSYTRTWNDLPRHVTSAPSLPVFCSRLKTHLFRRSFPSLL